MDNIGDKKRIGDYMAEIVGLKQDRMRKEKIIRLYNRDKKLLDRDKANDLLQAIIKNKKTNESLMIRMMTDQGPRTIKKLTEDGINWEDEEEYLLGSTNENASSYKEVFYIDIYYNSNFI